MNRQLKILAQNSDISMRLTFRHTFGTMLYNGFNTQFLTL